MSASSELTDILRRHAVGSQAELAVEANVAAMVIRAAAQEGYSPRPSHINALRHMLEKIDQVAAYEAEGRLYDFVDEHKVARESLEYVQVMARAARQEDEHPDAGGGNDDTTTFPVLVSLVEARNSVALDGGHISINDPDRAEQLAAGLEELGREAFTKAVADDRDRVSNYAVI